MRRETRASAHVLAALLYVVPVLWVLRGVLADPTHLVAARPAAAGGALARVDRTDQRFVLGTITATAQRLLADPRHFLDEGGCHPLPKPFTLGEHMIGESLLAAVPYAVWRDPLVAYNVMLGLSWWIAAVAMYALAFFWTRDVPAAFLAGLLFGFHPARIGDPGHPYLYANAWAPLLLLFAHRLFARARWTDAIALAAVGALQLLESFYRVVGVSLVALLYGGFLLVRFRAQLGRLWPKLLLVALAIALVAAKVFTPYLAARDTSGILRGRTSIMLYQREYLPGEEAWLGWSLLALVALGLVDRLRGARARDGYDPRLVLLAAALLVAWSSVWGIVLPFTLIGMRSPLLLLVDLVPGLDAVRALRYVWFELVLITSFFAAYGILFLTDALQPRHARIVAGTVTLAVLLELFAPATSLTSFRAHDPAATDIGVNAEQRALYAHVDGGAVLDLPLRYNLRGELHDMSYYAFLRGYHGRPAAACYNSYKTPLQFEIAALAGRLPDPAAADELYARGFRWIVVHDELVAPDDLAQLAPLFADGSRTELVARARHRAFIYLPDKDPERTFEQRLYRLSSPSAAAEAPADPRRPVVTAAPSTAAR